MNIPEFLDKLISEAVKLKASDIHIEPMDGPTTIRLRTDGELFDYSNCPQNKHPELIARIKILSDLDIAERRLPQDGRFTTQEDLDLRVSIIPTIWGEKAVIRLLNTKEILCLEDFDFPEENLRRLERISQRKSGMLISTGPTGCGKSTTLYALIRQLNNEKVNIITAEDPVEFQIPGVNQIQILDKAGYTFEKALRAMLRADPDIIMLGEIRDFETAEIAIRAAITGHLLLTTLHTFDAYAGIIRLLDMGIEPYLVASSLSGIQSQRLIKVLCHHCKTDYQPNSQELAVFNNKIASLGSFKAPVGCDKCKEGYKGRQAISEVFEIDQDFTKLIKEKPDIASLRRLGQEKQIKTMLDDGLARVAQGDLYLPDVLKAVF